MNPEEEQTEKILTETKEDLLKKYNNWSKITQETKMNQFHLQDHTLALNLVISGLLFIVSIIFASFALPVPDYPTNIFNSLETFYFVGSIFYLCFTLGYFYAKNKYEMKDQ